MDKLSKKNDVDDMEQEVSDVRKRAAALQKEMSIIQKQVTALETNLEQKKSERHSLLQACKVTYVCFLIIRELGSSLCLFSWKRALESDWWPEGQIRPFQVEDIKLPLARGSIMDFVDDTDPSGSQDSQDGIAPSQSQSTKEIYEREAKIKINYGQLDGDLKEASFSGQHENGVDKSIVSSARRRRRHQKSGRQTNERSGRNASAFAKNFGSELTCDREVNVFSS